MKKILTSIGLMSGTSLDGIDGAIIKTDGEEIFEFGESIYLEYDKVFSAKLKTYIEKIQNEKDFLHLKKQQELLALEKELTLLHVNVVQNLLKKAQLNSYNIDIIGFHGQTIIHKPKQNFTLQIGDGNLLARLTGINVIYDFRSNDVKHGGQGAPLVPLYHYAITKQIVRPVAIVNIGGVANVTYIDGENIIAFDTGPGCALIDDFVKQSFNLSYDKNGDIARNGQINYNILNELLSDNFFSIKPPKSLDRNHFVNLVSRFSKLENLSKNDYLATLTAFTSHSIAKAVEHFPSMPKQWLISGGGRKNLYLFEQLKSLLKENRLISKLASLKEFKENLAHRTGVCSNAHEDSSTKLTYKLSREVEFPNRSNVNSIDIITDGNMVEAQAFAFLAVRSKRNMVLTLPSTTGTNHPLTGGVFCQV